MLTKIKLSVVLLLLMSGVANASSFSAVPDLEGADFLAGRNALKVHISSGTDFTRDSNGIHRRYSNGIEVRDRSFMEDGVFLYRTMTNGEFIARLRKMGSLTDVQIGEEITDEQIAAKKAARKPERAEREASRKAFWNRIIPGRL